MHSVKNQTQDFLNYSAGTTSFYFNPDVHFLTAFFFFYIFTEYRIAMKFFIFNDIFFSLC